MDFTFYISRYLLCAIILLVNINVIMCQVPSTGCQAILDSYCFDYKQTSHSNELNWFESQLSCESEEKNLTTVRNLADHDLVLDIIPGSRDSRCWIGLNDIQNEGTLIWVDGSLSDFRLFENSNSENNDCVQIKSGANDRWRYHSCSSNSRCYVCGAEIIQFGTITGGTTTALANNDILFASEVIFCVTERGSSEVVWTYTSDSNDQIQENLIATSWNAATGVSTLNVSTGKQGFYQCSVTQNNGVDAFFKVGVFNRRDTTVVSNGGSYIYTIGIDRENIQLLCPTPSTRVVTDTRLRIASLDVNPINIFANRNNLTKNIDTKIECNDGTADSTASLSVIRAVLIVQGPPTITVSYPGIDNQIHSQIGPNLNFVALPLPAQTLTLTSSLSTGIWRMVGGEMFTDPIVINILNESYNETFQFFITNWDNEEVLAIQIRVITTGFADSCDVIYDGSCITQHRDTSGLTWEESEIKCLSINGHLASISSAEENNILADLSNTSPCWIGLNDRDIEARLDGNSFSWIDGSTSTFRNFSENEPTDDTPDKDYTYLQTDSNVIEWVNANSSRKNVCYFCKRATSLFGRILPSDASMPILNGAYFTQSVTLLCVNEHNRTTRWNSRNGSLSDAIDVTDTAIQSTNAISQLTANISDSGFYTCEISRGGIPVTFLASVFNFSEFTVAEPTENYTYIVGIDTIEPVLYCNPTQNVLLHNTAWTREGVNATNLSNPLNIRENNAELVGVNHTLVCTHLLDGIIQLTTSVLVQGPPVTTVNIFGVNPLSLLPPFENLLPISVLTSNIVLSANIENSEWELPDGRIIQQSIIVIAVLRIEHRGVYRLYSEQTWESRRTLLMMVNLEVQNFFIQEIIDLSIEQINNTIVVLRWGLQHVPIPPSREVFRIYLTNDGSEQLLGQTTQLSYTVTGLAPNTQYTFIVELEYAFTLERTRYFTAIQLRNPATTEEIILQFLPYLIPILVAILIVALLICCLFCCCIFCCCCRKKKDTQAVESVRLENVNDIQENNLVQVNPHARHIHSELSISNSNANLNRIDVDVENASQGSGEYATIGPIYDAIAPINEVVSKESGNYQEIEEIVDPIMRAIPLDQFKAQLDRIWENEGALESEYQQLGGKALRYACDIALLEQNKRKNKFRLVYPYDKSRVILRSLGHESYRSNYINASVIPGLYVPYSFIAAQAPKETTLEDFWQMIIDNSIVNIVMLTKLVENGKKKCEPYFPTSENTVMQIGSYNILLKSEVSYTGFSVRSFTVTDGARRLDINHFHFTAWPDHDVPSQYDQLLTFVNKVQEGISRTPAPILVHCSAGVGRTGTFITLFNLTKAIKKGRAISIYRIVHEMREHRPQMVQTLRQYKFIYLSVLEMLIEPTSILAKDFTNTYKLYLKSDTEGYISTFLRQFSELNYQCDKGFEEECTIAKNSKNDNKNHAKFSLPYNYNRIILCSEHFDTNYINATSLDNLKTIVTLNPTVFSLQDFLQMVYQYKVSLVVMLTTYAEEKLIESGQSDFIQYWPTNSGPAKCAPFILTLSKHDTWLAIDKKVITLTHTLDSSTHNFTQYTSTKWNSSDEPTDLCSIVKLLKAINSHKSDHPNSPIIIHCSDGIAKTGILYTIYKALQSSIGQNEVDIFHIIKKLRSERMNSIPELNHYLSCFALMNEYYCDTGIL